MKSFKDLAFIGKINEEKDEKSEKDENLSTDEEYEEIYSDVLEDIAEMKAFGKELGLSNEDIKPLAEAILLIDKVDDLIRSTMEEDENEEEDTW